MKEELPKEVSLPVVVEVPSVIQPIVITSSPVLDSSPLPSTSSLSMSTLLQPLINSGTPNDISYINTISDVSSASSDHPVQVQHTYVSPIKSQVRID